MFSAIRSYFRLFIRPPSGVVHGLASVFITLISACFLLALLSSCGHSKPAYERGTAPLIQPSGAATPLVGLVDSDRLYRQFSGIKHLTNHLFQLIHHRPRVLHRRLPPDTTHFYPTLMLITQQSDEFGAQYRLLNQRYQRYQTSYQTMSCRFKKPQSPADQLKKLDSRYFPRS